MRLTKASLAARSSVSGKNCIVSGSPLSAANGSRSASRQRRISRRSVCRASNRALAVMVLLVGRLAGPGGRSAAESEQPQRAVVRATHRVVIQGHASDAAVMCEHARLRLDLLRREDALYGREQRIAVEQLQVT